MYDQYPSSGIHKTVTTAFGTVQLPPTNVAKLACPRWRELNKKYDQYPSSGIHKTVTTASDTVQLPPSNVAKLAWSRYREVAAQKIDQYRRL